MINFNSIKVRLEQESESFKDPEDSFQFHKGTIRTFPDEPTQEQKMHFNSIKVRLEHRQH